MLEVFTVVVVVACALLAGWALVRAVRNRPVILRQLWGAAVVEAILLVELLAALLVTMQGAGANDPATFWGYLVTMLFVLPVAAAWAFVERTRWSSIVLLVATLTLAFMQFRLLEVWA